VAEHGENRKTDEITEKTPQDRMLLPIILQFDTVGVIHVSNLRHIQEPTQNGWCTFLLQHGTCHVLHVDVTGRSYQEMHEALAGGLAECTGCERSQNHVGQGQSRAFRPHLHYAISIHQWFYLSSDSTNNAWQDRNRECDDQTARTGQLLHLLRSAAEPSLRNRVFDASGDRYSHIYRDNQRLRGHRVVHHARLRTTQDVGRLVGELGERRSMVERLRRCPKFSGDCCASCEDT